MVPSDAADFLAGSRDEGRVPGNARRDVQAHLLLAAGTLKVVIAAANVLPAVIP